MFAQTTPVGGIHAALGATREDTNLRTISETAEIVGCSDATVRNAITAKRLPVYGFRPMLVDPTEMRVLGPFYRGRRKHTAEPEITHPNHVSREAQEASIMATPTIATPKSSEATPAFSEATPAFSEAPWVEGPPVVPAPRTNGHAGPNIPQWVRSIQEKAHAEPSDHESLELSETERLVLIDLLSRARGDDYDSSLRGRVLGNLMDKLEQMR